MLCDRSSLKFVDCVVLARDVCFVRVSVVDAWRMPNAPNRVTGRPRLNENDF